MPSVMRKAAEKKLKKPKKGGFVAGVKEVWKAIGKREGDRSGYRHASSQLSKLEKGNKPKAKSAPKKSTTYYWP